MRRSFARRVRARARRARAAGARWSAPPRPPPRRPSTKLASATLNGDGSTFQLGFNQVVIGDFKQQQKAVTINYQGVGSGTGAPTSSNRSSTSPAPTRRTADRPAAAEAVPLLPDGGRADHGVVQPLGREEAQLSADTIAKIFSGADHQVGRRRDQGRQPEGEAAEHDDHRRPPLRQLRHHAELHQLPDEGGAHRRGRSAAARTVQLAVRARRARTGNAGVAQLVKNTDGAIGYVDFSDAKASDLTFASIKNAAGKFVAPSTRVGVGSRSQGATVNADLTYDPINATGAEGVPDHVADVDHRVHEPDRRRRRAPRSRRSSTTSTATARSWRRRSTTRRCPRAC